MLIPIGFAQANFHFAGTAMPTNGEVTLGLDLEDFPFGPDALATALYDTFDTTILQQLTTTTVLTGVTVKYGPNSVGPSGEFAGANFGNSGSSSVPPNTSVLVKKSTALGGKAGSGRMFLPGLREDVVNESGVIGSGTVTALQGALDDFLEGLYDDNLKPMLLHGASSPIETPTEITAFQVQARVATQRRRLRR